MVPTGVDTVLVIVTVLVNPVLVVDVPTEVNAASDPLAGLSLKLMTQSGAEALALQRLV